MVIEIREYRNDDRDEWMRVHAIILSLSHAWNYTVQERPEYAGYTSTRLVAVDHEDGQSRIVGLTDVQYDNTPGEVCFLKDSRGDYVLELGRLPECKGLGVGKMLIDAAAEDAADKGFHRLEYWTQDRAAQRFYRRLKMKEIGRHYRFRIKPTAEISNLLMQDRVGAEYVYCACLPDEWPLVKQKYDIIQKHPLEPHLCVGFEIRF